MREFFFIFFLFIGTKHLYVKAITLDVDINSEIPFFDTSLVYFSDSLNRFQLKVDKVKSSGTFKIYSLRYKYLNLKYNLDRLKLLFNSNKKQKYFYESSIYNINLDNTYSCLELKEPIYYSRCFIKKINKDTLQFTNYRNNKLNGTFIRYHHINNFITNLGNYSNGQKNGIWYSFLFNKVNIIELFNNGLLEEWYELSSKGIITLRGFGEYTCPINYIEKFNISGLLIAKFQFENCNLIYWTKYSKDGTREIFQGNFIYNKANPDYFNVYPVNGFYYLIGVSGDTLNHHEIK